MFWTSNPRLSARMVLLAAATACACSGMARPDVVMPPFDNPPSDASDIVASDAPTDAPRDVVDSVTTFRGQPLRSVDHELSDVDAIGYEVNLRLTDDTRGSEAFAATTTATMVALADLTSVSLDLEGNEIDALDVNGRPAVYTRTGTTLAITLPVPVRRGAGFAVTVDYHGTFIQARPSGGFNVNGGLMVRSATRSGHRMFLSLNWPTRARRWMPTRDHPRDGAMFAMRATFPSDLRVISNGRRLSMQPNMDNTTTWQFEALTSMPTYDFHVAAYDEWTETAAPAAMSGTVVRHFDYTSEVARAAPAYRDISATMDFFERSFGPYRWDPLNFLEEPMIGGGMEHAAVVSMDETLFGGPDSRAVAIHEMGHHWSGNLVRIHTWNDFWLSEGFTDYLTRRFIASADGPTETARVWRQTLLLALGTETRMTVPHALRPAGNDIDPLTIFDSISYKKGAFVLRSLGRLVGEARLTTFLRGWFDRHAFGSATTADFQRELQSEVMMDLSRFFDQWIYAAGFPMVQVNWTYNAMTRMVDIALQQTPRSTATTPFRFPLDLEFAMGASTHRVTVDVTSLTQSASVAVPFEPTSMVPDPDQTIYGVFTCDATHPCRANYLCRGLGADPTTVCVPSG